MESKQKFRPNPNLKLMDQVREGLDYRCHAYCTEQTYCQYILRYIHYFGGKTHPRLIERKIWRRFFPSDHRRCGGQTGAYGKADIRQVQVIFKRSNLLRNGREVRNVAKANEIFGRG
jgi:hypothetical protein